MKAMFLVFEVVQSLLRRSDLFVDRTETVFDLVVREPTRSFTDSLTSDFLDDFLLFHFEGVEPAAGERDLVVEAQPRAFEEE